MRLFKGSGKQTYIVYYTTSVQTIYTVQQKIPLTITFVNFNIVNINQGVNAMKEIKYSRKDFLKLTGAAAAALPVLTDTGCSSVNIKSLPGGNENRPLYISNCRIIDVKTGTPTRKNSMIIRNKKIEKTGKNLKRPAGALEIDASGKYALPGFIDTHCHTTISPVFRMSIFDIGKHVKMQSRHLSECIKSGVTTVRDVGSFPVTLHGFVEDIDAGKRMGPRIIYCNSMLNVEGGHPDVPPSDINIFAPIAGLFTGMVMTNFEDTAELKEIMAQNSEGASFIKLTVDNKSVFCRKEGIPVYSDEQLQYIFSYAEKKELPVSCHCHRAWGFTRMMDYPVHTFEHIVSDRYLTESEIRIMEKKNIGICPTMTVGLSYLMEEAYDEIPKPYRTDFIMNEIEIRRKYLHGAAYSHCDKNLHDDNLEMVKYYKKMNRKNFWKNKIFLVNPGLYFGMVHYGTENLKKMKDAGIIISCAIDAGMPFSYFGGLYREMEFFARAGFTSGEILKMATLNGAKILGIEEKAGSIEEGKWADFSLFDENPLKDISACRKPVHVFKEGALLHSDKAQA